MGKPTGFGKREFYALKDQVEAMIAENFTKQEIYNKFHSEGKITTSYSMFCNYVNNVKPMNAKKEFLEVICEVRLMMEKGYSMRMIHKELADSGRINFCYDSLVRKIRDFKLKEITVDQCIEQYGKLDGYQIKIVDKQKHDNSELKASVAIRSGNRHAKNLSFKKVLDDAKASNREAK